jgi:hypothetical protein
MNAQQRVQPRKSTGRLRPLLSRRPRRHDPMLVFHLSIFNSADWRPSIFDRRKIHENVT